MSTPNTSPSAPQSAKRSNLARAGQRSRKVNPALDQQSGNRRQIAVTSFDLLNGSYLTTSRGRLASIIMLSVVMIVVLGLGLTGLRANLSLANTTAEIASLKERQRDATSRFLATTGLPEGVTEKQLIGRFEDLTNRYEEISVNSVDPLGLYPQIVAPNIFISSLQAKIKTLGSDEKKRTALEEQLYEGISELEPNQVLVEVTFTATAANPAVLTSWAQAVRNKEVFRSMIVTRSGNVYTVTGVFLQEDAPASILTAFARGGLPAALGGRETSETTSTNTGSTNTGGTNTGSTNTGGTNTGSTNTGGTNTGGTNTGGTGTGGTGTGTGGNNSSRPGPTASPSSSPTGATR